MSLPNYPLWEKIKREDKKRWWNKQNAFCVSKGTPCFVPESCLCPYCQYDLTNIPESIAESEIITACKKCKRSFTE